MSQTKDEKREYRRDWYQKNKERINAIQKKYYEENKKQKSESGRKYRQRIRKMAIEHCSNGTNKCNCCEEKIYEFLTIDHMNNNGAQHRKEIKGNSLYIWLYKNNYPPGYQVLCMNCNFSKGKYGYCPHERSKQ